jgi:hypothetical protein
MLAILRVDIIEKMGLQLTHKPQIPILRYIKNRFLSNAMSLSRLLMMSNHPGHRNLPEIPDDSNRDHAIMKQVTCLCIILVIVLVMLTTVTIAADIPLDVEKILRDIRQDQPVPTLDYLQRAKSINVGCAYYRGDYNGIEITVETLPNSQRVASVLLQIPGMDRTQQILPAVKRVIGPPHYSSPKESRYGWEWPNYRTASFHYARGIKPGEGFTIVSLFYQ